MVEGDRLMIDAVTGCDMQMNDREETVDMENEEQEEEQEEEEEEDDSTSSKSANQKYHNFLFALVL